MNIHNPYTYKYHLNDLDRQFKHASRGGPRDGSKRSTLIHSPLVGIALVAGLVALVIGVLPTA